VNDAAQLIKLLWQREVGETVKLTFWRGKNEREAWVTLGQLPQ
jgi:S1-C subfamily serine protease